MSDSMCKALDFKKITIKVEVKSYGGLTLNRLRSMIKAGLRFSGKYVILMVGTYMTDVVDVDRYWKEMEGMRRLILGTNPFCDEVYAAEILPRVYRPKLCQAYNRHPTSMRRIQLVRHYMEHRDQVKHYMFAKDGFHLSPRGQKKLLDVLIGFFYNARNIGTTTSGKCRRRRGKRQRNQHHKQ